MKKLLLILSIGLLWCNSSLASCEGKIDVTELVGNVENLDGTPLKNGHKEVNCEGIPMFWSAKQKKFLTKSQYEIENMCLEGVQRDGKIIDLCPELKGGLDFSKAINIDELNFNSELIDMREYGTYSLKNENDKYFLNILAHNLLDLNAISKREFKKILKYKRKKSANIQGVKLFCGADPNLIGKEDIEMIGIEFRKSSIFIGYGLEGDTWHDIKGNYKRTSSDIELNYSLVGTDKEDSFDIDRKTLKPGINTQCAIINPSISMIKIFKNIQSVLINSNENKL